MVTFRRSRTNGVTVNTTKSGKTRKVPLSPTLEAALKAHRHLKGPLAFCQEDGRPLTLWHLHGALDRAARRAGLRGREYLAALDARPISGNIVATKKASR